MVGNHRWRHQEPTIHDEKGATMIVTKVGLPRRTFLRGVGTTLALPFLDAMWPACTLWAQQPASRVRRLGVVYVPNGMVMESWTPSTEGSDFELSPILEPLTPFRDQLLVTSNLDGAPGGGSHAGAATRFLTGMVAGAPRGAGIKAGISMDQIAAKHFASETQLASLELALDSRDFAGTCDAGYACAYSNTISWRGATTPLPMENDPRAVFERLFGGSDSTRAQSRVAAIRQGKSILDSVLEKVQSLERDLGQGDRNRVGEYLSAVRDVERRIQKAEEQSTREIPIVDRPTGVPTTFEEHARLMFDLQVLAYLCDLTRVTTFMIGREQSGRSYPEIGVAEAHHPLSHHEREPAKLALMATLNTYHVRQFAYFLEKMRTTADAGGSLLDSAMIVYGAGMSESNEHYPTNLPIVIAGGGGGRLRGGRHVRFADGNKLSSLMLTLLDKMDVPVEPLGGNQDGRVRFEPASL
jgi:hypothetical protein